MQEVSFIIKGCLQVYVYNKDINETTLDIVTADSWCTELMSFGSGKPATENIWAIEPCDVPAIINERFGCNTQ